VSYFSVPGSTLLAQASLSGATSYTGPTFPASAFQQILIDMTGSVSGGSPAGSHVTFKVNADASLVYAQRNIANNTTTYVEERQKGDLGYAEVASYNNGSPSSFFCSITFYPLTNGFGRVGYAESASMWDGGAAGGSISQSSKFLWQDTATAVTFYTLGLLDGASFTGIIRTWGVPA
jgi:hypothetical protein